MNRREFILLTGATFLYASDTDAESTCTEQDETLERNYSLRFDFDLSHNTSTPIALWVPLPKTNDFQKISEFKILSSSKNHSINSSNFYEANTLYCDWKKDEEKKLSISFDVKTTKFASNIDSMDSLAKRDEYINLFTKSTKHIQTDGIVLDISNKICAKHKTEPSKARAIYDWVVENMYRDPTVKGCGVGDAKEALEQKRFGGKCLDISAVFVALLRSQNIPARELMGIRLGSSKISDAFGSSQNITSAQHCRAEFFIENIGWIRADPADVTKLIFQEKLQKSSKRVQNISQMYFGSFEMNWMKLNHARDFILHPKPIQFPLDQFNYPYGEADDLVLDFYDANSFKYKFSSVEAV